MDAGVSVWPMSGSMSVRERPWFDKAIAAERYCCDQFLHFNLGRGFFMQGEFGAARRSFE